MDQVYISGLLNPVMNNVTIRDMAYADKDLESFNSPVPAFTRISGPGLPALDSPLN